MNNFSLAFGALCDPIEKQLREQGLELVSPSNAQELARAITLLAIRGCLTISEVQKACKRLMKCIRVKPIEEAKP